MNDYIAEITLDLNCERSCQTIMLTQFDKGKKIHLTVTANGAPYSVSGCSVVMKGINSDGSKVNVVCDIEQDGTATAVTDDITFSVKGFAAARFVISDSQRTYNTQRFLIYVDDALDTDVTSDPDYSILNRLIRQVQLIDEHGGIIVDDELSTTSTHPVQNRVVNAALGTKAPLSTAFTFDDTTTNVVYNENNPRIIYLNAVVDGQNGIVITSAHNASYQLFFGRDGSTKIRVRNGADSYAEWQPAAEKAANKSGAITNANKTSTELFPSIKAVVDYLAANYEALSNKLTSADGIDENSTDTEYPTAKAVFDFGVQIVDGVNEEITETKADISDLKAYIGYTSGDILGLHADFENKQFTRLGAAFGTAAIIERMEKLQAIMALRCSGYNQAVFKTWFNEPDGWLADRVAHHKQIRDDLMQVIEGVPGVSARPTEGGSYLFVTIPELEVSLHDFIRIVRELAGVTVTPGTEFGPQYLHSFRINFSQDHDKAVDAMKRLFTVMERYRK